MIRLSEIAEVGRFNKPHGIKGEISVSINTDIDLNDVKCVIVPIDGIFVPFFLQTVRPKTADTSLPASQYSLRDSMPGIGAVLHSYPLP